jgi:hypothetical protein
MLVWLAEHLVKYYSGFNVFSYLTFRAIVSLLTGAISVSARVNAQAIPSVLFPNHAINP